MEQPTSLTIAGLPLTCPHCSNDKFHARSCHLDTPVIPLFNLDWLNPATNYVCSQCGRIEWFTQPPGVESYVSTTDGDTECLECGETVPHGMATCPKCGWSYEH